jgi:hypothetical protein
VLLASGVATVLALTTAAVVALHRPAPVPTSGGVVAVLPFAVRGGGQYTYLREGMVDLLSTNLDGAGTLRSVDPRALLAAVPATPARELSPAAGRATAQQLGAGLYVLGDVIGVEGASASTPPCTTCAAAALSPKPPWTAPRASSSPSSIG